MPELPNQPQPIQPPFRVKFGDFGGIDPGLEIIPGAIVDPNGDGTQTIPTPQPQNFAEFADRLFQPQFISITSNGEIGECQIEMTPYIVTENGVISLIDSNTPVQVFALDYTADPENPSESLIFDGIIVKAIEQVSGEFYGAQYITYNRADHFLFRKCLYNQTWKNYTQDKAYAALGKTSTVNPTADIGDFIQCGKPTIFNPQGKPNCAEQRYIVTESGGVAQDTWVFEQPERNQVAVDGSTKLRAIPWTIRRALSYLRTFLNMGWAIDPASWTDAKLAEVFGEYGWSIKADGSTNDSPSTQDAVLYNLNLQGKTLNICLREILEPFGYGYSISPGLNDNGFHDITFFIKKTITDYSDPDDPVLILSPIPSGTIRVDATEIEPPNCINYEIVEDATPIVDVGIFTGNQIVHTTLATNVGVVSASGVYGGTDRVLPLVHGWNHTDLSYTYNGDGTVNSSGPLFTKMINTISGQSVYGVGRTWIVNTGENSDVAVTDLNTIFNTDPDNPETLVNDIRPLEPPKYFQKGALGANVTQLPIMVEASMNSGTDWFYVDPSRWDLLHDKSGIIFTDPNLDEFAVSSDKAAGKHSYWQALKDDTLCIRIVCSIKSDTRVGSRVSVPRGYLSTERVFENLGFDSYQFETSVNTTRTYVDSTPLQDVVDDTQKIIDLGSRTISATNTAIFSGRIVLYYQPKYISYYLTNFQPGLVVTGIADRRDFSQNPPYIAKQIFDCENRHLQLYVTHDSDMAIIGNTGEAEDMKNFKSFGAKVPFIQSDTVGTHKFFEEHKKEWGIQ